ncbi:MAG: hypothetical protein KAR42_15435 [candidate division Zixibacteria bacterium]|nr:hypothetical protein [candidate division Zixibacteria bacterium]
MPSLISRLWGVITGGDAGKTFPQQQGKALDRVGDMFVAFPYGLYSNLPNGQMFKVIDEDGRVILGLTVERPDGVAQGEVVVFHPGTDTKIHLTNSNELNIETSKVNIIASDSVNIDAPVTNIGVGGKKIALDGDPIVAGLIVASGTNKSI